MNQVRGEIVARQTKDILIAQFCARGGKTVAFMEASTEAAAQAFIDGALTIWRYTRADTR